MLYLMRHGQDDENYIGGWSNVSLIESGIDDVREVALWIKDNLEIKKIISSSVKRAVETSTIVSEILGIPFAVDDNLREQNKGDLNGMLKSIAYLEYPDYVDSKVGVDTVYPNGESLRDLYKRIKMYLSKIMELDDNTLIITHRGVINMIYFILNDIQLNMDKKQFKVTTGSVHEIDKKNKTIKKVR